MCVINNEIKRITKRVAGDVQEVHSMDSKLWTPKYGVQCGEVGNRIVYEIKLENQKAIILKELKGVI